MEALWDKLLFWKKPKKPEYGKDYTFYNIPESDYTGITILLGKYRGVTYYYGTLQVQEQMGFANLKFEYKVIDTGSYSESDLNSSSDFVKIIGDILTEILISEEAKNESYRNDNTEEFDLQ